LALDENIFEIRREKLKKIDALGHPAYPRRINYSHTVPQILAEYGRHPPSLTRIRKLRLRHHDPRTSP
jgi:hypothetical protein